jgi:hypothetical protein
MLEGSSAEDRNPVEMALLAWRKMQPSSFVKAGELYRGEKRQAVVVNSMREKNP